MACTFVWHVFLWYVRALRGARKGSNVSPSVVPTTYASNFRGRLEFQQLSFIVSSSVDAAGAWAQVFGLAERFAPVVLGGWPWHRKSVCRGATPQRPAPARLATRPPAGGISTMRSSTASRLYNKMNSYACLKITIIIYMCSSVFLIECHEVAGVVSKKKSSNSVKLVEQTN